MIDIAATARRAMIFSLVLGAGTARASVANGTGLTDIPIEQLLNIQISTASKFEQPITEAPSVVSVITASEIKSYGWRTLADLLASIRGLYVTNDRNYSYLGGRGFLRPGDYNSRFLLLVDGDRNNDSLYDQASLGRDFVLDLDMIERVEFAPGPGSSIYGSNAFFGVINVITKRGRDALGPRAGVELGSAGERNSHASYGWQQGQAEVLLSANSFRRDGRDLYFPEFDSAANNHGIAHRLDYEKGDNIFFKGRFGDITLSAAHVERTKGIPTASFSQVFNDPRSLTGDAQTDVSLSYDREIGEQSKFYAKFSWGSHDYYGQYLYASPDELNYDGSATAWWNADFNIVSTHFQKHKLLMGLDYQRDYKLNQYSFDSFPSAAGSPAVYNPADPQLLTLLNDHRRAGRAGIYLQDEISVRDDLLVNAGLRYDHNSLTTGAFSPRLALIYKFAPDTTFKALLGRAFRSPNSYELYYSVAGDGGQKANPLLKPEHITTREISVERQLSAASKFLVSAYRNSVSNLISQTTDPRDGSLVFENLSQAVARGIEGEYEQVWSYGARLRASYSWQRTTDGMTGAPLVDSPLQLGKLNVTLPLEHDRERLGLEAQYVGQRESLRSRLGGYWIANLTVFSAKWIDRTEISFSLYNLLDRRYAVPGGQEHVQDALQQDGRSFRMKLVHSF